jgi:hypothetical protein
MQQAKAEMAMRLPFLAGPFTKESAMIRFASDMISVKCCSVNFLLTGDPLKEGV